MMRRFFIDSVISTDGKVMIDGREARHMKNVLRLKTGEPVILFDGSGVEYEATIDSLSSERAVLSIHSKSKAKSSVPTRIIVAQSFLKEKKMDTLVRQLCELGMAKWVPFFSERSVSRPDKERLAGRINRWRKISIEALKQSRRTELPEINDVLTYDEVLALADECDLKIIFWENEPIPFQVPEISKPDIETILLVLGPEGGFTEDEIRSAKAHDFVTGGLGPRILRAETAALAACTLVQYVIGDMGQGNLK
jgi:16S rRNA (uracil1498-N3)-methyltransferase